MHDQSASRTSGRTPAAVSAMYVRALRITVLKSAGNFTRGECYDLSAEKIQGVKCFMLTRYRIVARQQFSNAGAAGCVRKFQTLVNFIERHSRARAGQGVGSTITRRSARTALYLVHTLMDRSDVGETVEEPRRKVLTSIGNCSWKGGPVNASADHAPFSGSPALNQSSGVATN
jgi:hypothetical protein